jgi:uncharacterized membrane protein YdbT with pleckstrin-like domain
MKKCPFCAEEIQDAAIVCKHCGRELAETQAGDASPLLVAHPSLWTQYRTILIVPLAIAITILGRVYLPDFHYVYYVLIAIPIVLLFVWMNSKTATYTVTSRSVIVKKGLASTDNMNIDIKDIRSINVHQSVIGKIFNIGDIQIGTSGTSGVEINITGVSKPNGIKDLILKQKK